MTRIRERHASPARPWEPVHAGKLPAREPGDLREAGLLALVPNPLLGSVPVGTLAQPMVQRGRLLRPYPQYPGVNFSAPSWGNCNYHSFQSKIEKRFSVGDCVVVAYTFSKLISDGGDNGWDTALWRDYYCRACGKPLSPYDQ